MGHAKVPAEVPEDSLVLRARYLCTQPLIASTPGSFPDDPVQTLSRVNHGLTQRARVTQLLVLCLAFFNKKSVTKWKQALQEVVQGHVASDHG